MDGLSTSLLSGAATNLLGYPELGSGGDLWRVPGAASNVARSWCGDGDGNIEKGPTHG